MVETLELVRKEWQRRVVAEYGSAAITHSLLGWLMRLGASPTLLHEATRIVDDELVHAEQAFVVLREAGGDSVTLGGELGLEAAPGQSLLIAACVHGTRVFCLGETVAVRLFKPFSGREFPDCWRSTLARRVLILGHGRERITGEATASLIHRGGGDAGLRADRGWTRAFGEPAGAARIHRWLSRKRGERRACVHPGRLQRERPRWLWLHGRLHRGQRWLHRG